MTPCIEYQGFRDRQGYGRKKINGKTYGAHRIAYSIANNVSLDEMQGWLVRHACDNPSCVNPEHLLLGTVLDNSRDQRERGRTVVGTRNGRAKMVESDIPFVRHWLSLGYMQSEIAKCFQVDRQQIYKIAHGKHWKHV